MNFLETLKADTLSEFEMLKFLKVEVKKLAEANEKLEKAARRRDKKHDITCLMAYSCGYEDRDKERNFDVNFDIKSLKGGE